MIIFPQQILGYDWRILQYIKLFHENRRRTGRGGDRGVLGDHRQDGKKFW